MSAICPYCRMEIADQEEQRVCETCGTPHHADCFAENGGCTIFGCRSAPTDEPKVRISSPELGGTTAAAAPAPVPASVSTPPPPPPAPISAPPRYLIPEPPRTNGSTSVPPPPPPTPQPAISFRGATPAILFVPPPAPKKRVTFVLLGIFLGTLGIHNFYAGYAKKGIAQVCISVLTLGYGALISWIWAIVEVCTVEKDGAGIQFA